jgi:hypothetical protein
VVPVICAEPCLFEILFGLMQPVSGTVGHPLSRRSGSRGRW